MGFRDRKPYISGFQFYGFRLYKDPEARAAAITAATILNKGSSNDRSITEAKTAVKTAVTVTALVKDMRARKMSGNNQIQMPQMPKEAAYGLVEQFRTLGKRVAFPGHDIVLDPENGCLQFELRDPWYTNIPVACVEDIKLTLDGREIPADSIEFVIRDMAIPFRYAVNLHELIWSMGEIAVIRAKTDVSGLKAGDSCRMELEFEIRTPFEGYHLPNNRIRYLFDETMTFVGKEGGMQS